MFLMFKVNEGGKWLFGAAAMLEEAKAQILAFAELWSAEYAILNQETEEWSSFPANRGQVRIDRVNA